jgi:hypothetical protein
LKKPAGSVRFRFYKQKTEKTEPKPTKNWKKNPSQNQAKTEPNHKKPSQNQKKPRKPSQNWKN